MISDYDTLGRTVEERYEDLKLEYKEGILTEKKGKENPLLQSLVAMANARGGDIVLGVGERGETREIVGAEHDPDFVMNWLSEVVDSYVDPVGLSFRVYGIADPKGKRDCVGIEVGENQDRYFSVRHRGKYGKGPQSYYFFVRVGSTDRRYSFGEILNLALSNENRLQRRAWRRELLLKSIDKAYAPMTSALQHLLEDAEKFKANGRYTKLNTSAWDRFRNSGQYYQLDDRHKESLRQFYEKVRAFNDLKRQYEIEANDLILRILGQQLNRPRMKTFQVNIRAPTGGFGFGLRDYLLTDQNPLDSPDFRGGEVTSYDGSENGESFKYAEEGLTQHFRGLWPKVAEAAAKNPTVTRVRKLFEEILKEGPPLSVQLQQRIKEQWEV